MAYCQSDFKNKINKEIGNFPEGNFSGVRSPERAGRKSVIYHPIKIFSKFQRNK
jgi:hypothetical protein